MIKYASNAFLATKISFINEIASDLRGAGRRRARRWRAGMGHDAAHRAAPSWTRASASAARCFPKDVKALAHMAAVRRLPPAAAARGAGDQPRRAPRVSSASGTRWAALEDATVALLGLAFKQNTDDLREAPALEIVDVLLARGARRARLRPGGDAARRARCCPRRA